MIDSHLLHVPGRGVDQDRVALEVPDDGDLAFEEPRGGRELVGVQASATSFRWSSLTNSLTTRATSPACAFRSVIDERLALVGLFGVELRDHLAHQFKVLRRAGDDQGIGPAVDRDRQRLSLVRNHRQISVEHVNTVRGACSADSRWLAHRGPGNIFAGL